MSYSERQKIDILQQYLSDRARDTIKHMPCEIAQNGTLEKVIQWMERKSDTSSMFKITELLNRLEGMRRNGRDIYVLCE